jgi:hypothetical protein
MSPIHTTPHSTQAISTAPVGSDQPATGTPSPRSLARLTLAWLTLTLLTVATWARGDQPIDDRGSDSSEKAFMVILAITLGGAVTVAAVAFVSSKTALFK